MTKASSEIFLFAKVYRTMTSGRKGAPYFRIYGRALFFQDRRFCGKKVEGSTVERLRRVQAAGATGSVPLSTNELSHIFLVLGSKQHTINPMQAICIHSETEKPERSKRLHFFFLLTLL